MSISIPVKMPTRGMTADPRNTASYAQLVKHFDNFTKGHSLIPYRGSSDAYASQATAKLQSFLMYQSTMYALGVVSGSGKAQILSNTNITTPSWASPTNGADSAGTTSFKVFVEYHGVLYGATAGNRIWAYDINNTTFTPTAQAVTYTSDNVAQGLVHSKDDILYIPIGNIIWKRDYASGATVTLGWLSALTLPNNLTITSISEYGNYLAIACAPTNIGDKSRVFLWDRDSSVTTLSDSLDLGNVIVSCIEQLDGYLIAVSLSDNTSTSLSPKMVFSAYAGGATGFEVFNEIPVEQGQANVIKSKQKVNNRLFFGVSATSFNHTTLYDYTGVWSIGKTSPNEPFSVVFSQVPNNDTIPASGGFSVDGFISVQNYFYIAYTSNTVNGLSLTNTSYGATSVWRTTINPNMSDLDKMRKKKLLTLLLTYGSFPSGGSVTLKYRVDGGSWTSVVTETTQNAQFTEMPNANGTSFTDGRDYDFEIQDTGGVEITGLAYKIDGIPTNI